MGIFGRLFFEVTVSGVFAGRKKKLGELEGLGYDFFHGEAARLLDWTNAFVSISASFLLDLAAHRIRGRIRRASPRHFARHPIAGPGKFAGFDEPSPVQTWTTWLQPPTKHLALRK